jgi:hypothetical protein
MHIEFNIRSIALFAKEVTLFWTKIDVNACKKVNIIIGKTRLL